MTNLAAVLGNNLQYNISTFIHLRCEDKLRNQYRPKRRNEANEIDLLKRPGRRSDMGYFDFKVQCFYCGKTCTSDFRHLDRKTFEAASTKDTKIYSGTLKICIIREDTYAKSIERHLLSEYNLVAPKARIIQSVDLTLKICYQNTLPEVFSSTEKPEAFEAVCTFLEDKMELMTLPKFQTMMEKQHTNV